MKAAQQIQLQMDVCVQSKKRFCLKSKIENGFFSIV